MAKLSEEIIDGVTVLHLVGSLTQDNVPNLERRLKRLVDEDELRIVIDIEKVDAITTPAITVFLSTVRAIESKGGKLIFANVQGIAGDIFARCRLDVIFTMGGDVTAAVKAARG
jgi:anti-anti-sigma factor